MERLTSLERVMAVIQNIEPDRVPHFEFLIDDPVIKSITKGGNYGDLIELMDHDAAVAKVDYRNKKVGDNIYIDEWQITRGKGFMQAMVCLDDLAAIKNLADLKNWNPPDPFDEMRLDSFKQLVNRFKGKRAIFIQVRDVWSLPRDLLGYMELMVACISNPEIVTGIIEKGIDHNIKMVEQAAKLGAEFVITGDDIADNRSTLISPKMWAEIFEPYFQKLSDAFHAMGLYYWKHSDGNIMPVMDSLVACGIDGIDPIDPLGGMSLAVMKEKYGSKIAIKGNIDCANLLVNGTPEEVIDAVKECIRIAGPGGGYVCSSSNSIHSGVNPALYQTMVDAIQAYGKYPLDMELLDQKSKIRQGV
jgi:uroporphyrinogen decarboxylase